MTLQVRLLEDLKEAMRTGDATRRSTIRLLRAAIKNAEIDRGGPLDDAGAVGLVQREIKRHQEAIEQFQRGRRPDLVAQEEAELRVLLEYLPPQMSEEAIAAAARQVIAEVGARSRADMGKVMAPLMAQLRGRADGRTVSRVVESLLTGR